MTDVDEKKVIDLYGMTSPNVQKIRIMLEETELPFRLTLLNVHKGDQNKPEFVKLNPNRKVPVIVDHDGSDGKPIVVFESGAILLYLAEKTSSFMPVSKRDRYEVLEWLMIQLTGMGPMFGQFFHFAHFTTGHAYPTERYTSETRRLYDLLEWRLGQARYVGGRDYSIADISVFPWIRTLSREFRESRPVLGVGHPDHPNINRWFEEVSARPAVQRALSGIDATKKTMSTASAEELDRYFGRGEFARSLR